MIPIDLAENAAPSVGTRAIGTVITVNVFEAEIDTVLQSRFDRLVVERSDNSGESWSEATSPATRPVLEPGKSSYIFRDYSGSAEYLYRVRYLSSTRGELTEAGPPIAGSGLAIRNILTAGQLKKRYLFGIDLTNDNGEVLEDEVFDHYILAAIRSIERELDVPILPTRFLETQDFILQDFQKFNFLMLDYYPVISVNAFNIRYLTKQTVTTFPNDWLRVYKDVGQIQVVPTGSGISSALIAETGGLFGAPFGSYYQFPEMYEVDYIAGFESGKVPRDIVEVIGMAAALGPFGIFGDLITGAGIGNLSLSMDGLSQSITTTQSAMYGGYGSRVNQYSDAIKKAMPIIRSSLKRVGGMVVA